MKAKFWVILLILVIAGAAFYFFSLRKEEEPKQQQNQAKQTNSNIASPSPFEGELQISDNPAKGNLMLLSPSRTLYVKTSRDFNSLLGKQVKLIVEGDELNFTLKDIQLR